MIIFINDEKHRTDKQYLFQVIEDLGYQNEWIATAVNNNLVTADQRQSYLLKENDKIEILKPMQGG